MTNSSPIGHPCAKCALHRDSVWQPVGPVALPALTRGFARAGLGTGQLLFAQDDENKGVFCVSSGLIALRTRHADGTSTLVRLAYPGDVIGFRSFLADERHQTEGRALLPSRVCRVTHHAADRVMHESPAVLNRLALRCVSEIDAARDRVISAATKPNRQRLSDLLLRLMRAHGQQDGDRMRMQLPLSRSDLADLIGVQPETMSRLIRRLQDEGVFKVSGREVEISATLLDQHRLREKALQIPA